MKLVAKSAMSTKFDKHKRPVILIVISGDEVLLLSNYHQDGITYDVFGTLPSKAPAIKRIMQEQLDQINTSYPVKSIGTMTTYINKPAPDGRVKLTARVFLLNLTPSQKQSAELKPNHIWLSRATLLTTPFLREDDKYFLQRVLDGKDLNIIEDVDQYGKWIDAKLVAVAIK